MPITSILSAMIAIRFARTYIPADLRDHFKSEDKKCRSGPRISHCQAQYPYH